MSVSPLAALIRSFELQLTSYADDTQIVLSIQRGTKDMTATRCHDCLNGISGWMAANCLKLNAGKTEVIIFGNNPHIWSPEMWPECMVKLPAPVDKAKNLGVILDHKLDFGDQVSGVVSSCFYLLRILRKIKFFLPADGFRTGVSALILSRLDYCNSL